MVRQTFPHRDKKSDVTKHWILFKKKWTSETYINIEFSYFRHVPPSIGETGQSACFTHVKSAFQRRFAFQWQSA